MPALYPGRIFSAYHTNIGIGTVCYQRPRGPLVPITAEHSQRIATLHRQALAPARELLAERPDCFKGHSGITRYRSVGQLVYFPSEPGDRDRWHLESISKNPKFPGYGGEVRKRSGALLDVSGNPDYQTTVVERYRSGYLLRQQSISSRHGKWHDDVYYRMAWPTRSLNEFFGLAEETTIAEEAIRVAGFLLLEAKQYPKGKLDRFRLNDEEGHSPLRVVGNQLKESARKPHADTIGVYARARIRRAAFGRDPYMQMLLVQITDGTTTVLLPSFSRNPFPLQPKVQTLWREIEKRMGINPWAL